MKLTKSFKLALNILMHSKLRSWLTIIGIIIGIAAVVSIISISQGAQESLEEQLGGLGADIITVSPGAARAFGAGGSFRIQSDGGPPGEFGRSSSSSSSSSKNLTSKDVMVLRSLNNVKLVMGQVSGRGDLTYSSKTATISVKGIDTSVWKDITTENIEYGRFLTKGDSYSIILGADIVDRTFENGIPLNSKVIIEGKSFKVVGITEEGSTAYIPLEIARETLEDIGDEKFDSISIKIEDVDKTDETISLITERLMFSRGILDEKKIDFSVSSMKAAQESIQEAMSTMSLFLAAIAGISLLVGAIGIANTMFTSVLEKTREIGIMKSIGAKNKDILTIFLLNSGLIGLVGGIGGVILGVIGSGFVSSLTSTSTGAGGGMMRGLFSGDASVSFGLLFFALAFSVLIGMIAGVIPAYRASKLKPVDALRYE